MTEYPIRGSFDLHVHANPDIRTRKHNVLELVKEESKHAVRGIVVKSHHVSTYIHAKIVNELVLGGTVLYGGVSLNYPVCGFFNEEVVETALKMDARVIWMPTISAAHHLKFYGEDPSKGIRVTDRKGEVIPEVERVIKLAIDHDAILATGHISPSEIKALVREASSLGLKKVVVTHPESPITNMRLEDQIELVREFNVYMEYCALSIWPLGGNLSIEVIADQIKALGSKHVIISTDLGQPEVPSPVEGMKEFLRRLSEQSLGRDDILRMIGKNPLRLIEE